MQSGNGLARGRISVPAGSSPSLGVGGPAIHAPAIHAPAIHALAIHGQAIDQERLGGRGRPVTAQQVGEKLAPSRHQAAKQGLTQGAIGPAGIADYP